MISCDIKWQWFHEVSLFNPQQNEAGFKVKTVSHLVSLANILAVAITGNM